MYTAEVTDNRPLLPEVISRLKNHVDSALSRILLEKGRPVNTQTNEVKNYRRKGRYMTRVVVVADGG